MSQNGSQIISDFIDNRTKLPPVDKDFYEIKFSTKENTIEM
jgi:hypothetical protein